MTAAGRVLLGGAGALAGQRLLQRYPPGGAERWMRTNHRGRQVSLLSGPAAAVAGAAASGLPRVPALLAAVGAGGVGAYDDAAGGAGARGLRGHLAAFRSGEITTGLVKVVGITATGIVAAAARPARTRGDLLLDGAVIAGSANLLNLLDLRPGRALKVAVAAALVLGRPGVAAAGGALLPGDLSERTMLGDAGANALGALLGVAAVERLPTRPGRVGALGLLIGLTAASEVVSFSAVIDRTPALRVLDRLGRLP